jgi:hypothetical protein
LFRFAASFDERIDVSRHGRQSDLAANTSNADGYARIATLTRTPQCRAIASPKNLLDLAQLVPTSESGCG